MIIPVPLPALLPLDEAEVQAWRQLERRLRQLHGFGLLVYFVRTPVLAARLRKRLHACLDAQQRKLALVAAVHPENFAEVSLKALFGRADAAAPIGVHWLEAYRGAGQPLWDSERRELLARLNERRSRLEAEFHEPLVLLLPAGAEAEMAMLAPDLWHIRLPTAELVAAAPGQASNTVGQMRASFTESPQPGGAEPPVRDALSYWFEQWHANFDDLNADEIRPDHPNLDSISLWDGGRALDACLKYGRFEQGGQVAKELLAVARARVVAASPEQKPPLLRDVSASLDCVGRVAEVQGDWAGAEQVYRESMVIRRELVERLGGTPEALRDVSISLNNVGRAAEVQGDWSAAEGAYRECLEISRTLAERLGTPEVLRAVWVSLNNVGQVAQAQGDLVTAQNIYREGLETTRMLAERLGNTPEALRDVVVSLVNVGRVAEAQGHWSPAESAYRESLGIAHTLVERLGSTPEALRDVSIALDNVGWVAQAQGDQAGAEQLYRESLVIRRELVERLGSTPEALDDVGIALVNIASLPNTPAQELLAEAATIYASLVRRCPQVPQYVERLKMVQERLNAAQPPDHDSEPNPP